MISIFSVLFNFGRGMGKRKLHPSTLLYKDKGQLFKLFKSSTFKHYPLLSLLYTKKKKEAITYINEFITHNSFIITVREIETNSASEYTVVLFTFS